LLSSKRFRALHIEDIREVHIPAQSNTCRTAQSEASDINEKIQEGIQAAIPGNCLNVNCAYVMELCTSVPSDIHMVCI
jgi:hypothetical protein